MTPKEKAEELVNKIYYQIYDANTRRQSTKTMVAKECALIAVDELIYETQFEVPNIRQRWWQDVKQHIHRL